MSLGSVSHEHTVIASELAGMGFELVAVQRDAQGLLRVFIDHLSNAVLNKEEAEKPITLEDCEQVSRHLSYFLPVKQIDYERLEISSPGMERPLTRAEHFVRFVGAMVRLKFHNTPEVVTALGKRRLFAGVLLAGDEDKKAESTGVMLEPSFCLQYEDEATHQTLMLRFALSELESASLMPDLTAFSPSKQRGAQGQKGRRGKPNAKRRLAEEMS